MALFPRIKVTTSTTGTSDLTLSATGVRDATYGDCLAPAEFLTSGGVANRLASYFLVNGNNFAFGTGRIASDGLTLYRDAFEKNWNGTTFAAGKLSLTGTTTVMLSPRPSDLGAGRRGRSLALARGAFL